MGPILGYNPGHILGHIQGHILRHVLGHILRHIMWHILGHITGNTILGIFWEISLSIFTDENARWPDLQNQQCTAQLLPFNNTFFLELIIWLILGHILGYVPRHILGHILGRILGQYPKAYSGVNMPGGHISNVLLSFYLSGIYLFFRIIDGTLVQRIYFMHHNSYISHKYI